VHDLAGHHGPVAGLVFAADGRRLVSAGSDGTLRLWQVDAASPVAGPVISVNAVGAIRALAASPDGRWLAFGTESGHLCLWRWLADGPEEAPCDPAWRDKWPVTTVMFSPKGRWLATTCAGACGADSAPVRLWDLSAQGAARGPKPLVHRSNLTEPSLLAIAFSADETRLAAAYGYVAELWDLTQPTLRRAWSGPTQAAAAGSRRSKSAPTAGGSRSAAVVRTTYACGVWRATQASHPGQSFSLVMAGR
jgi:WD40 repeat protein